MISRSRILITCVQVLVALVSRGVVLERMFVFGFKYSLVASGFFIIFRGAIISGEQNEVTCCKGIV
jgi:hypothetical protein